jgi:hypothetical protein
MRPTTSPTDPSVLVVYASFGVGGAIAQRLMGTCVVSLAHAAAGPEQLRRSAHDVVVLCPYLTEAERMAVLVELAGLDHEPSVIEMEPDEGDGTLLLLDERPVAPAARTVLAALTPLAA